MHDPSASHSLLRLGCLLGTFSPSRRQMRSTRLSLIIQTLLVLTAARDLALRRAMLPERRTGATLGDMQLRSHLLNAGTATRGA
jgi:hypothetical protein